MSREAVDELGNALQVPEIDARVTALKTFQAFLAASNEPLDLPAEICDILHSAIKHTNANLQMAALSCLDPYFTRLVFNNDNQCTHKSVSTFIHPIIEKLGDSKPRNREIAQIALRKAAHACLSNNDDASYAIIEASVKENALPSKNAKTREQALLFTADLRSKHSELPLRSWLSPLLLLLEDQDSIVREAARDTIIKMWKSASPPAKADLKKELSKGNVRQTTADAILAEVLGANGVTSPPRSIRNGSTENMSPRKVTSKDDKPLKRPKDMDQSAVLAEIIAQAEAAGPSPTPSDDSTVRPVYAASAHDVEQEFASMLPAFEGKETEHNWSDREKAIFKIRGLLKSGAHEQFHHAFLSGFKAVLDGTFKAVGSLRTTLATATCKLYVEAAEALGRALDPLLDQIMSNLLKMAALTKKTVAQISQQAVEALIRHCGAPVKVLHLLSNVVDQKTVQARSYAVSHLRLFIQLQLERSIDTLAASGSLELLQDILKKGLADSNASTRDAARGAFWDLNDIAPDVAQELRAKLDVNTLKQLEKANPANASLPVPPSALTAARPSIRSMISAARAKPKEITPRIPSSESVRSPPKKPIIASPKATPSRPASSAFTRIPSTSTSSTTSPPRVRSPSNSKIPTTPSRSPRTSTTSSSPRIPVRTTPKASSSPSRLATPRKISLPAPQNVDRHLSNSSTEDLLAMPHPGYGPSSSSESLDLPDDKTQERLIDMTFEDSPVDAAIRAQAEQAELAAERLLELVDEPRSNSHKTPKPIDRRTELIAKSKIAFRDSPALAVNGAKQVQIPQSAENWWIQKIDITLLDKVDANDSVVVDSITQTVADLAAAGTAAWTLLNQVSYSYPCKEDDSETPKVWKENKLFDKTFTGLESILLSEQDEDRILQALILLKHLVSNQTSLIRGQELSVLSLLLELRGRSSRTIQTATEGITLLLSEETDPIYALSCARSSLETFLTSSKVESKADAHTMMLKVFASCFTRLPAEVLEEELPKCSDAIKQAVQDKSHPALRQSAVQTLLCAQSVLDNAPLLFELAKIEDKGFQGLVTYFLARHGLGCS